RAELPDGCETEYWSSRTDAFSGRHRVIVMTGSATTVSAKSRTSLLASAFHVAEPGVHRAVLELEVDDEPTAGGRLRLLVRDPEGRPVTDYDVRVGVPFGGILAAAFEAPAALLADGATPLLPAGTVRLVIESGARIGLHERSDAPVFVVTEV